MGQVKQHAKYAASSAYRWLACPGSIKLSEGVPPQEESEAAKEGTKAHELMEFALLGDIKNVVKFWDDHEYPLEMREHVQYFVDYVRSQMKPDDELLVEQKIQLPFLHKTEAFGTVDVSILSRSRLLLHVIDFKYGRKHVDHVDNPQMNYYALGLFRSSNFSFRDIKTTIFQPRASKREPVRTHEFKATALPRWEKKFLAGIKECESENPSFNPGDHCFFCPAKIKCPYIYKKSLQAAGLVFEDQTQPDPKDLEIDQLETLLEKAVYLEMWIDEVKKFATDKLKKGEHISGWGLVPTRPQRVWKDELEIELSKVGTILTKHSLMSPAEAEKVLKAQGWSKEKIEKFLKGNVSSVSSGVTLSQTTNDYDDLGLDDLIID